MIAFTPTTSLPAPYYQDEYVTIYHGDCLEIMGAMPNDSIEVIFTDPPYGHSNQDGDLQSSRNTLEGRENIPIANDTPEEFRAVFDGMLKEAIRVLVSDCCCCCCCCGGGGGPSPTFAYVANRMDSDGFKFFHSVIWDKKMPGLGMRFRRQHEMLMFAHNKKGKFRWAEDGKAVPNIYSVTKPREMLHPNEKPLYMFRFFLDRVSRPGDTILDPFMGSGTTLRAAKDLGRRAVGIELEERYCEIAAKRMQQEVFDFRPVTPATSRVTQTAELPLSPAGQTVDCIGVEDRSA